MEYQIIRETEKAFRISVENVELWIPKSWIKKDGSLGKKAEEEVVIAQKKAKFSANFDATTIGPVVRETEKAVQIGVSVEFFHVERIMVVNVWFPKSMVKNADFCVKNIRKTVDERYGNLGGYSVAYTA